MITFALWKKMTSSILQGKMRKEVGWQWYHLIGLPSNYSRCDYKYKYKYKSMQAKPPSCERPITNQRTLFLSFAINNCYPTSDEKLLAVFELILGDFFHWKPPLAKCLLICLADFYRRISDHCEDAEVTIQRCFQYSRGTFAETPNVARIICVIWKDLWRTPDSYSLLKYRGGWLYNTVVSNKFMMWKWCRNPTLCWYLQTIIECK